MGAFGLKVLKKCADGKLHTIREGDPRCGLFEALHYHEREIMRVATEFQRVLFRTYLDCKGFSLRLAVRVPLPEENYTIWNIEVSFDANCVPQSVTYLERRELTDFVEDERTRPTRFILKPMDFKAEEEGS